MSALWQDHEYLRKHCQSIHAFGLGFIQIKMEWGTRIHLYTAQVRQTQEPEEVHDHRYGFISTVEQGRLVNKLWAAVQDPAGEFTASEVTCKAGEEERPLFDCRLERVAKFTVLPGASYELERDTLHRVRATEGTITTLTRDTPSKEWARVVRRKGAGAVCPFSANQWTEDELWEMYRTAVKSCA